MSGGPDEGPEQDVDADRRRKALLSASFWLAAICLAGLVAAEILGMSTPWLRGVLMIGVAAAGTGVIVVQAQRRCPNCGAPYGYHLRITNANTCRQCGAEFPGWPMADESDRG